MAVTLSHFMTEIHPTLPCTVVEGQPPLFEYILRCSLGLLSAHLSANTMCIPWNNGLIFRHQYKTGCKVVIPKVPIIKHPERELPCYGCAFCSAVPAT